MGQHTKDYGRAIARIRDSAGIKPGHEFEPSNFEASIALAVLTKLAGDQAAVRMFGNKALRTLSKIADDSSELDSEMTLLANWARAHLLLGENDKEIDELQRATQSQTRFAFPCEWMFPQHAVFDPVRNDPRFQSVRNGFRDSTAMQQALLEKMRAKGEVPTR